MIVEISNGWVAGYGEATTNPYYQVTEEGLLKAFSRAATFLEGYRFEDPEKLWSDLYPVIGNNLFALSAVDCASHDLFYRSKGKPYLSRWGIAYQKYPLTSYTLGIGTVKDLRNKIHDLPWPIYKIKIAGKNDGKIVSSLRKYTDALIRVDANCAWRPEDSYQMADELHKSGVEFIEQPFRKDQFEETKELTRNSPVPIIADESCQVEDDVEKCAGNFYGINIKLAKCGGLTPAIRMIESARSKGLKIMIGCMTESTIGISAAAQLLPFVDYADLDGPLLLSEDVATGLYYRNGSVLPGKNNGLGFRFKQHKFSTKLPI
jgi:L-alanine-DL-glutamate epimerase-like enolase superfamily enzyme